MKKILTLCLIHNDTYILLGMKKCGFGAGRWNGFGGKVREGEMLEEAAKREVEEEIGLIVKNLEKRGILNFTFKNNPEILEVHIFSASNFEGNLLESEEMKPQWFPKEEIPFDLMWPDDRHWLPLFLQGKNFRGYFHFSEKENLLDFNLEEI